VYCDGLTGALYLDKPSEVEAYAWAWEAAASASLSPKQSRELLLKRAREMEEA